MSVCVTGATGLIGRLLVRRLIERADDSDSANDDVVSVRTLTRQLFAPPFLSARLQAFRCGSWEDFVFGSDVVGVSTFVGSDEDNSLDSLVTRKVRFNEEDETLEALRGCTTVVHLAGEMNFFPRKDADVRRMRNAHVRGSVALARAAAAAGAKRFIYVSSTEALGASIRSPGADRTSAVSSGGLGSGRDAVRDPSDLYLLEEPARLHELSQCKPEFIYGETKAEAEDALRDECELLGLRLIILRPTGVFGPGDSGSLAFELIQLINSGLVFVQPGPADGLLQYSHVEDVCSAIIAAIETPDHVLDERGLHTGLRDTLIIAPDDYMSHAMNIRTIARLCGRAEPLFVLPLWLAKALFFIFGPLYRLLVPHSQGALEVRTLDAMSKDRVYSNLAAKRVLGWRPRYTFATGLSTTMMAHFEQSKLRRWSLSPLVITILLLAGLVLAIVKRGTSGR